MRVLTAQLETSIEAEKRAVGQRTTMSSFMKQLQEERRELDGHVVRSQSRLVRTEGFFNDLVE